MSAGKLSERKRARCICKQAKPELADLSGFMLMDSSDRENYHRIKYIGGRPKKAYLHGWSTGGGGVCDQWSATKL